MKRFFAILLIFPLLAQSAGNSLFLLNKGNRLFNTSNVTLAPKKVTNRPKKKEKLRINDVPWAVSIGMIAVGSGVSYYFGANQQNKPTIATIGGGVAIAGGLLATFRVWSMATKGKFFSYNGKPTVKYTEFALGFNSLKIGYRF